VKFFDFFVPLAFELYRIYISQKHSDPFEWKFKCL